MVSTMSEYARRKQKIHDHLGGRCVVCGVSEGLNVDHIDASTKSFDVMSNWSRSWATLRVELDKCQLLCIGHHKEKTKSSKDHAGGRNRWSSIQHGKLHAYGKYKCRCDLCKAAKHQEYLDRKSRNQAIAQYGSAPPLGGGGRQFKSD